MFNHPQILAEIARERQHELIAEATEHRQAVAARRAHAARTQHQRGAPGVRGGHSWNDRDARSAGRLTACEAAREITVGQAR